MPVNCRDAHLRLVTGDAPQWGITHFPLLNLYLRFRVTSNNQPKIGCKRQWVRRHNWRRHFRPVSLKNRLLIWRMTMASTKNVQMKRGAIRRLEDPPVAQSLFGEVRWA